jgi:hypothetical protein
MAIGTAHAQKSATLPMNGLFYGTNVPGDAKGNSVFPYHRPIGWRFRAEMTGEIVAIKWEARWGPGYSSGRGGKILLELRKDTGLKHPPLPGGTAMGKPQAMDPMKSGDPNLLGVTGTLAINKSVSASGWGYPEQRFSRPVPVVAGKRYWVVFHQRVTGEYVSLNSVHIKGWKPGTTDSQGGPYWKDDLHIARSDRANWTYQDGTHTEESRHIAYVWFLYRLPDGKEVWSGIGNFGFATIQNVTKSFSDGRPIRQRFKPSRSTFKTDTLYFRAYIKKGEKTPGPMKVELSRGNTTVGSWTVPASAFPTTVCICDRKDPPPAPVPFTKIALKKSITIESGVEYTLKFGTSSGQYYTHAHYRPANDASNRNTFKDGSAEYSANRGSSWSLWNHNGGPLKAHFLPFMFEVKQ